MRLPLPLPLLLLLLLEMAGTCYIITEGGKTHTFRQYLQQKTQTENIPTILKLQDISGRPEAVQKTGGRASRTSSHTSVLRAGL